MISQRSFTSELSSSAGGVFTVLFSIVLTVGLVGVLNDASGGRIDTTSVFEMMVYTGLVNMSPILAVSLFIAVLMVLIRSWQDNEMIVWFSTGGLNLFSWIRPVFLLSLPVALIVGAMSLSVSPWAKYQIKKSTQVYQQRDDMTRIAPGRFIESDRGQRVFFIESVDAEGTHVKGVFMNTRDKESEIVVEAQEGVVRFNEAGDRYIVLKNGTRYETSAKSDAAWRVMEFDNYELRMDVKGNGVYATNDIDKISLTQLLALKSPLAHSQLMWRLSWPIATLVLAFLAIPLSHMNPRAGRNLNLILAALIFILYLNAISIGEAWVKNETLNWVTSLVVVNGGFAAIAILLFLRRVYLMRWLPQSISDLPYKMLGGDKR